MSKENSKNESETSTDEYQEIILSIDIGKKNLGYTIYSPNSKFRFGIFNITEELKKRKLKENIEGRNTILIKWLTHIKHKYDITKIVVEKQVIRNVVAMCIQSCITSYAIMKKIEIISFDPKLKFKFTGDTYNSQKKEHKKLAIKYATKTINEIKPKAIKKFSLYKKQDDISDSIVMALMSHSETDLKWYKKIIIA